MVNKNPHRGSTLDEFLEEEGVLEEFHAAAIKEVIAWQERTKKRKKRSKAVRTRDSRA